MTKSRILVVEDHNDTRYIITKSLDSLNCIITEAANGKEALKIINESEFKFDLIISDLMMPELSGKEFIYQFKSLPGKGYTPILIITAKNDMDTKEEILEIGGDDYITKPFNKRDLLAKARVLMRINQLTLNLEEKNSALERSNIEILNLQNQLIREEREKTKHKIVVSSLHLIRQPLTNALLLSGVLKQDSKNSSKTDKLTEALNDINKILLDLENINLDESTTYINNIEMLKS